MEISYDDEQIENLYRAYYEDPDAYRDRVERLEQHNDIADLLMRNDSLRAILTERIRVLIYNANAAELRRWSRCLFSTNQEIDHRLFYSLVNALPYAEIVEMDIGSQFVEWANSLLQIEDLRISEMTTLYRSLIIGGKKIESSIDNLLQQTANAVHSPFVLSSLNPALIQWIGSDGFQVACETTDLNRLNCLYIILNHLHWCKLLDSECDDYRDKISVCLEERSLALLNKPLFAEIRANLMEFISIFLKGCRIEDYFRLLLTLPNDTISDLIEHSEDYLWRHFDRLEPTSSLYPLCMHRLCENLHLVITALRESEDMDFLSLIDTFTYLICKQLVADETPQRDWMRVLLLAMSLGYYESTRLIYITIVITPHLQADWDREIALLGLDMELICDLIEDSVYDCPEILAHFYEERPRLLRIKHSVSESIDPISCEPLSLCIDELVVLPDTNIVLNRSTLESHFRYQGMTNPYTRKSLSWEEVNEYTARKLGECLNGTGDLS